MKYLKIIIALITIASFFSINVPMVDAALLTSIQAYWKLDESGTGTTASDSHASNDLTNNNSLVFTAGGKINNAADFEKGSSQTFSITDGDQSGLEPSGNASMTIAFWWKPETEDQESGWCQKWGSQGNRSYRLGHTTNSIYMQTSDDGSSVGANNVSESTNFSNGTWYHLAFVFDASTPSITIYIDASSPTGAQGVSQNSIYDSSADVSFGFDLNNYLDGIVDEFGFWSRALSSSDVSSLYNSGDGFQYPFGEGEAEEEVNRREIIKIKSENLVVLK